MLVITNYDPKNTAMKPAGFTASLRPVFQSHYTRIFGICHAFSRKFIVSPTLEDMQIAIAS